MIRIIDGADSVRQPSVPYFVGDSIDWATVVSDLRPVLLSIARRVLGDDHSAEDAVQDGLLRAWTGAHRLKDRRALRAWIMTIVRRAALDRGRRTAHRRRLASVEFEESTCIPHESARREPVPGAEAELREEIGRLPNSLGGALACASDGCDLSEYARQVGISYAAAKTRLSRARAALRRRCVTDNGGSAKGSRSEVHS